MTNQRRKSQGDKKPAASGSDAELKAHMLAQLEQTHARFAELMEKRFETSDPEDLERYFALMSTLVGKLENESLSLKDVMREMAAEYAAIILTELNR